MRKTVTKALCTLAFFSTVGLASAVLFSPDSATAWTDPGYCDLPAIECEVGSVGGYYEPSYCGENGYHGKVFASEVYEYQAWAEVDKGASMESKVLCSDGEEHFSGWKQFKWSVECDDDAVIVSYNSLFCRIAVPAN